MKKSLILNIALVLIFALVGCGQRSEADVEVGAGTEVAVEEWQEGLIVGGPEPDVLSFSSLEEFLLSYIAVRDGMRAEGFMPASVHGNFEHFSEMAESVDLLSLERFYLPINIPEGYQLFRILVYEYSVVLGFASDMDILHAPVVHIWRFSFSFTRNFALVHGLENPMAGVMEQYGVTEAGLIDGKFLFRAQSSHFNWASGNELLSLQIPRPLAYRLIANGNDEDLLQFTEVYVIDLADEDVINAILGAEAN